MGTPAQSLRAVSRLETGTQLGNYVIERTLGHGGEGHVYAARDVVLGRQVAIKALSQTLPNTRGVEEARRMAALEHPNIVRVYEALRRNDAWYVVLELAANGSLYDKVLRLGHLPLAEALEYTAQAAAALSHAHLRGLVHRDVKPHNLLLASDGTVKLSDFGLAMEMAGAQPPPGLVGTPAFLAPERWSGGPVGAAGDIYSLGACLYFLLTGHVPFPFSDIEQLKQAHISLMPKPPAGVPKAVADLLLALLAKRPEARPALTAEAVQSVLRSAPGRRLRGASRAFASSGQEAPSVREAECPSCDPRQAHQDVFRAGPDRVVVEAIAAGLDACRPIHIHAPSRLEGEALLGAALETCRPQPPLLLAVRWQSAGESLEELVRRRCLGEDEATLAQALEHVALGSAQGGIVAVSLEHAVQPRGCEQALALSGQVSAAKLTSVFSSFGAGRPPEAFGGGALMRFTLPRAESAPVAFRERVALWTSALTDKRIGFTSDALTLLSRYCRTGQESWGELTTRCVQLAVLNGLPLVTSWAVKGAAALPRLDDFSAVPNEWRRPPSTWPDADTLASNRSLRTELGPHCRYLPFSPPSRYAGALAWDLGTLSQTVNEGAGSALAETPGHRSQQNEG